ncbi:MAG TPA: hypothetical protein VGM20_14985 [Gemmatimonadales bacterium]
MIVPSSPDPHAAPAKTVIVSAEVAPQKEFELLWTEPSETTKIAAANGDPPKVKNVRLFPPASACAPPHNDSATVIAAPMRANPLKSSTLILEPYAAMGVTTGSVVALARFPGCRTAVVFFGAGTALSGLHATTHATIPSARTIPSRRWSSSIPRRMHCAIRAGPAGCSLVTASSLLKERDDMRNALCAAMTN